MDRMEHACRLLQEVVFQSRAKQAAGVSLARKEGSAGGTCGLGAGAALELGLSPPGHESFLALWPQGVAPTAREQLERALAQWVERQDAFDRERNHFLRDFRRQHGFDRTQYTPELRQAFDSGLESVNSAAQLARDQAARSILAL